MSTPLEHALLRLRKWQKGNREVSIGSTSGPSSTLGPHSIVFHGPILEAADSFVRVGVEAFFAEIRFGAVSTKSENLPFPVLRIVGDGYDCILSLLDRWPVV